MKPSLAVRYYPVVLGLAVALVLLLAVLHVGIGSVPLGPAQVVAALLGHPEQPFHRIIIWDLRLPRTLIAIAAGAMLGLAGAILQAIMRNPLAEPEMTGATAGAVLFIVLWLAHGPSAQGTPGPLLPWLALAGGLLAGALVYLLSGWARSQPIRLIMTGLLVSVVLRSVTSMALLLRQETIGAVVTWLIGSLNGRVWAHWDILWPWALVSLALGLGCVRWANALQLGEVSVKGLGVPVGAARAGLLFVAVALTAGAVAVVGGIAFLGLIVPHIARRIVGADARRVFPLSMALGAALLLAADILAQVAFQPATLPVGAVLALLGAPFFLVLARRRRS